MSGVVARVGATVAVAFGEADWAGVGARIAGEGVTTVDAQPTANNNTTAEAPRIYLSVCTS